MQLQEWYDDDNEDYDEYELKAAIKAEHGALLKTGVLTRVQKSDDTAQQLKDVIQTNSAVRSRPCEKQKRLKPRFLNLDLKATHRKSTWTRSTQRLQQL
eukprot:3850694-Amphidinium_carterae.1